MLAALAVALTIIAQAECSSSVLSDWAMGSSADIHSTGAQISLPTYVQSADWMPVTAPATVIAGLVQNNVKGYVPVCVHTLVT